MLPTTALVGRSLLAYMPPFQVWCKTDAESGAVMSILTGWIVILDESGELRTPPNHTYTDEEEDLIQTTLRGNLERMRSSEMALSPTFLRLLGQTAEAAEVETAIEEKMEVQAARKRRREQQQQVALPVTEEEASQKEATEEEASQEEVMEEGATEEGVLEESTDAPT